MKQVNLINTINPLNAELNSICHLLALLGAHHILHVRRRLEPKIQTVSMYFRFTVQKKLANHISVICVNLECLKTFGEAQFHVYFIRFLQLLFRFLCTKHFVLHKKLNAFCLFEKIFIEAAVIELIKGALF
jgi:hypothetical protein